jgi:hypothetical protein
LAGNQVSPGRFNPKNADCLATFRRKISDFWIVADEVRKARPAALAAGVI